MIDERRAPSVALPYIDSIESLDRTRLHAAYRSGALTPVQVVGAIYDRIAARGNDAVWISMVDKGAAIRAALNLPGGPDDPNTPLWGLPFAVKDNIDVLGLATTAACPEFAYVPDEDSASCARLLAAGAILIGKTNLDQFATGLNGTRSPYGAPRTPFDDSRISGGSSSGSAVAVSAGLVTFALGTDTAGSGRVPAALTNTVGLKPSIGLVSSRGMLPACASLDCVTVFSLTVADGSAVLATIAGVDPKDPGSRALPLPQAVPAAAKPSELVIAIPSPTSAAFVDDDFADAWMRTLTMLTDAGVTLREIDFSALFDIGDKLYSGAWLAERFSSVERFLDARPDAIHPVTRSIVDKGRTISGATVFRDLATARAVASSLSPLWADVDALVTPTVTGTFTVEEMEADPVAKNALLGRFSTFTNILDLAAVAVPTAFTAAGLPFGITVSGRSGSDAALASIATMVEALASVPLGATGAARPSSFTLDATPAEQSAYFDVAVVGAHLEGMPLHSQLTNLDAQLVARTRTSGNYRLFALPNTTPPKPGLKRVVTGGISIELEVYRLSPEGFGRFVALVPSPLAIGTVELHNGTSVHGFVCEPWALNDATDVSEFGGWRAYARILP